MSKKVGIYCRVSTHDQSTDMQLNTLREYCSARGFEIYKEYADNGVSGTKDSRPALNELMDAARKHKIQAVVVYKFDRFARSTKHLVLALEEFQALGIDFISYSENIDTSTPMGKAVFTIISSVAELERSLIVQRVKAGQAHARKKGVKFGPKTNPYSDREILSLKQQGGSTRQIGRALGISNATVSRRLRVLQSPKEIPSVSP